MLPKGVTFNEKAQFCCSEKFRGFDSLREPTNYDSCAHNRQVEMSDHWRAWNHHYFCVQKMKCYQIKKQGVRYVTLTLNKDGLCFSVEPQNKESNTYLGLIMDD